MSKWMLRTHAHGMQNRLDTMSMQGCSRIHMDSHIHLHQDHNTVSAVPNMRALSSLYQDDEWQSGTRHVHARSAWWRRGELREQSLKLRSRNSNEKLPRMNLVLPRTTFAVAIVVASAGVASIVGSLYPRHWAQQGGPRFIVSGASSAYSFQRSDFLLPGIHTVIISNGEPRTQMNVAVADGLRIPRPAWERMKKSEGQLGLLSLYGWPFTCWWEVRLVPIASGSVGDGIPSEVDSPEKRSQCFESFATELPQMAEGEVFGMVQTSIMMALQEGKEAARAGGVLPNAAVINYCVYLMIAGAGWIMIRMVLIYYVTSRNAYRQRRGLCIECGYAGAHHHLVCPECGTASRSSGPPAATSR